MLAKCSSSVTESSTLACVSMTLESNIISVLDQYVCLLPWRSHAVFVFLSENPGCQNGTGEKGKGRNHTGQKTNKCSALKGEYTGGSTVVGEVSISV